MLTHYGLPTQLQILGTKFIDSNEKTVSAVMNYMKNNNFVQTDFYSEIIVLLKIYLVSSTRRIKIGLKSRMSQERLNECMLLSIQKEKADKITLKNVANVFCEANEKRRRTFGFLCDTDFLQLKVCSVDIFKQTTG